jgi:hypothetical protein
VFVSNGERDRERKQKRERKRRNKEREKKMKLYTNKYVKEEGESLSVVYFEKHKWMIM